MAPPRRYPREPPDNCRRAHDGWEVRRTCFEWGGDDQWIRDDKTDEHRVDVAVEADYDNKVRECLNDNGSGAGGTFGSPSSTIDLNQR